MSVFILVGILILSMLIVAFLQLVPGVFLLFSHYSYGKYSRKVASNASLFFILGAETSDALIFILTYFMISSLYVAPIEFTNSILVWIIAGIMMGIGIVFSFRYFRKGRGTELFISRSLAKNLNQKAKLVKNRSDAFALGFASGFPELIFTIPVNIVVAFSIMQIGNTVLLRAFLGLCFVLIKITPLIATHLSMNLGQNLAILQKIRVKSKQFVRFFGGSIYILIGILMIMLGAFSL